MKPRSLLCLAFGGLMAMAPLPLTAQADARASESEEARYFDFWPGTWVEIVDGRPDRSATTFTVRESVHSSAFEERWRLVYEGSVHHSVGLRAWDEVAGRWRFTWIDDGGLYQVWEGRKVGEHWYIEREFDVDGERFLSRQAWIPRGDDELVRVMERSFDEGLTWQVRSRTPFRRVSEQDGAGGGGDEVRPELGRHFERYAAEGTFVLYDPARDRWVRSDPDRAAQRFLPASTFKIFNSLVAVDEGVIEGANAVIEWDGVDRGSVGWNQDQTLRTAFERSAVWAYQELARRVGEERMEARVRREGYGNGDTRGGIDRFWLSGALRISPDEQVDFLRRLHASELGFSERTMRIVREIMVMDEDPRYILHGKTGWAAPGDDEPEIGWFVGWVERDENSYFFALNLETRDEDFPMREARESIARAILRELGVLPEAARSDS